MFLGVNGYIWIAKHVEQNTTAKDIGINRLEETVSKDVYSSQNEAIAMETRREIARISGCIRALVECGQKVDEKMILDTYEASLEMEEDEMESGSEYITGKRAKAIVEAALSTQG